MPAVKGRRHRATSDPTVPMQGRVQPQTRAKARAVADALGVSMSAYLDQLVANDQLDADGRPVWWAEPDDQQEALPLTG